MRSIKVIKVYGLIENLEARAAEIHEAADKGIPYPASHMLANYLETAAALLKIVGGKND